jgi:YVTN family beta-propeller protein
LAIPPGGQTVWASSYEFSLGGDVLVLHPSTGQLQFIAGPTGGLSFAPGGTVLYVANPAKLMALDVPSMHQIAAFQAENLENIGQAIPSPDGKLLFVSISFVSGVAVLSPGDIVVLDSSSLKLVSTINVPGGLGVFALTPDGSTLVCTSNFGRVLLISTATGALTATIHLTPSNGLLQGIALSPDGSTAYVTDAANNLLFVADLAPPSQQAKIAVGRSPLAVAISTDGTQAWVATNAGLEVVDVASGQVSGPILLPGTPSAIAFAP